LTDVSPVPWRFEVVRDKRGGRAVDVWLVDAAGKKLALLCGSEAQQYGIAGLILRSMNEAAT
jgi:hypothetical protein